MSIFSIVWIIWCLSEVLLNIAMRSGPKDKRGQDKGTLAFIWIMIALAITLGVLFSNVIRMPIGHHTIVPYFGLIMILAGMTLRFLSIRSLGKLFTVNVTIREKHTIKKDGFYRIVRHPSYAASLLSFIGFGISLNNWLSLLTVTTLVVIAFLYRIRIEEKALMARFGKEYLDYKNNTYCLIPWIY